jgi:hypothetical protein
MEKLKIEKTAVPASVIASEQEQKKPLRSRVTRLFQFSIFNFQFSIPPQP